MTNNNECDQKKNEKNTSQHLAKETFLEFSKSLLVGIIPTGLDYFIGALIMFLLSLKSQGYTFAQSLFIESGIVSPTVGAIGTAVGYLVGFIASYLLSISFIFKHNKKAKKLKGILLYIGIELFIYAFNVLLGSFLPKVVPYIWAFAIRISISYVIVFLLRKILIFMPEKQKRES